jgi:hypothetical protein
MYWTADSPSTLSDILSEFSSPKSLILLSCCSSRIPAFIAGLALLQPRRLLASCGKPCDSYCNGQCDGKSKRLYSGQCWLV